MNEKREKIEKLIREASQKLEQARTLSEGLMRVGDSGTWPESFYFDGPAYGMGGSLENGAWSASSQSC